MLLLVLLATMSADDRVFHVIVNRSSSVQTLTREEVSAAFMKRVRRWPDGTYIEAIDQRPSSGLREAFSEEIHEKSVRYVIRYWQRLIFSGRGIPPREADADEAVIDFVAGHNGAIGYVDADTPLPETVRVIAVSQ